MMLNKHNRGDWRRSKKIKMDGTNQCGTVVCLVTDNVKYVSWKYVVLRIPIYQLGQWALRASPRETWTIVYKHLLASISSVNKYKRLKNNNVFMCVI